MTRFSAPINAPVRRNLQDNSNGSADRPQPQTLEQFQAHIKHEFVTGSAIDPDLYTQAIRIVSDTETATGGEVQYPIDEAFNWQTVRFGQQARVTQYAALLMNEDGQVWQGKLSQPRIDRDKTQKRLKQVLDRSTIAPHEFWSLVKTHPECVVYQKYETPIGKALSPLFLPAVSIAIRRQIARRYGITDPTFLPTRASRKRGIKMMPFWEWIAAHPEIPIVWTEGGKKVLCLLSLGVVAIALYGVNGGYRSKDALGNPVPPYLAPDVARFAVPGRVNILAFDQDASETTRRRVNTATQRFARLLQTATQQPTLISFWLVSRIFRH
jgi:hypothetical protein